ncbi:serine/arginine-rich splicing factor RS40-like isoform X1 [Olea europaea var. sylvestris]|uniref:Serine arginine-rich splicing factor RS31-like isoform X1 n=2 Tax=Olea europaea subsp. europaea TaxID=158383 RepID=A0A8S0UUE5_OLEEU|nr:serine/arginine-rich splicing factor RS40-like isoform X1 [Olea europaea var. sylvestris]CAA3024367.1 serine arginine-rich splicing factor RS31-like isoform X1 [Olea europaea subsp. europaea]
MRPIFCGNFEYDARQSDLERLFRRYGKVDRVDMKAGFAFVYMEDERDAEDAIRALDRIEFGRKGRRLRVEWTKQERSSRRPENSRKPQSNSRPSKTLFVINFDPYNTRTRDLEKHFDPYGKILNVRIRKNFAFIQYETQEAATKALDATNMSKMFDRVISVEYAIKDDDERRSGHSPGPTRDRSPRRGYDQRRSPSPYKRERASPDYGHGHGHGRSPSPYRRERASPDYGRKASRSPSPKERESKYDRRHSPSPRKARYSDYSPRRSPVTRRDGPNGDHDRGLSPGEIASPDYGHGAGPSPRREQKERASPDGYDGDKSPNSKPVHMDSPGYSDTEAPLSEQYEN